jgi:hypothetical protein
MLFWYIQHTVAIVRTGRVIRNMMFHTAEQRGVPVERVDHILRMLRHTGTSHTLHYLHRRPLSRMQSLQVPCEAYCTPASALSLQIQHSLLALALHTRQTSTERATKHICRTPQIKMLDTRKRYSQTVKAKLCFKKGSLKVHTGPYSHRAACNPSRPTHPDRPYMRCPSTPKTFE